MWSDKIRRMSTWGTWGLMGVNVLLFLIFQVAVEPWRRRRLVKGFEDKVVEALEKEKTLSQTTVPVAIAATVPETSTAPVTAEPALAASAATETSTSEADAVVATEPALSQAPELLPQGVSEPLYSRLTSVSSSPFTTEYWKQVLHELRSERSVTISQRELTVATIQSAAAGAAGAAVVALLIAFAKPQ